MAADEVDVDRRAGLVDRRTPGRRDELETVACGPQDAIEGLDRWVGALALELGDPRLAHAQASGELRLGEAGRAASVADEQIGAHGPSDYNLEVM